MLSLLLRSVLCVALMAGLGVSLAATEMGPTQAAAAWQSSEGSARVIVRYKSGSSMVQAAAARGQARAQHAQTLGARTGLSLRDGRAMGARQQVLQASGMSSQALAEALVKDEQVEWAVPDRRRRATYLPNDPYFATGQSNPMPPAGQWWLRDSDSTLVSATRTSVAWDSTRGSGVVVAVLDTGVRSDHPDLSGRFLAGYNMISLNTSADGSAAAGKCISGNGSCRTANATDPGDWVSGSDVSSYPGLFDSSCIGDSSWHGTQVSGIVGASTNNALGVAGMAGSAKILPVRVLGKCGGYDSDIIDGIRWAAGLSVDGETDNANPAQVINLSLGGSGSCGSAYQSAIDEVTALGVVVVAAAGNEGGTVGVPANCDKVIAVGGLRHVGTKVGYSNLGSAVDISAPAGNCVNSSGDCLYPIVTTSNDGSTSPGNAIYTDATNYSVGTSFASPIVAGTVALMLSAHSSLTPTEITALLKSTARSFPTTGGDSGSQTCRAPGGPLQDSECYCTTSTCGAGMLDTAAAVAAAAAKSLSVQLTASTTSPVAGATVTLSSSASNVPAGRSIASYAWSLTQGSSLASFTSATNASTATLDTTGAGAITVSLTITDNQGNAATGTIDITATASTLAAVISASNASPEEGDAVTLSASGSTVDSGRSVASYQWSVVSGSDIASITQGAGSSSATLTTTGAGTVTVRLIITDDQGLSAQVDQALVISAQASGGGGGGSSWLFALGLGWAGLSLRRRGATA